MMRSSVLLPQPEGPTRATKSPSRMARWMSWRAVNFCLPAPKNWLTPTKFTSSVAVAVAMAHYSKRKRSAAAR